MSVGINLTYLFGLAFSSLLYDWGGLLATDIAGRCCWLDCIPSSIAGTL